MTLRWTHFFLISKMRKGIEKTYLTLHGCMAAFLAMQYQICLFSVRNLRYGPRTRLVRGIENSLSKGIFWWKKKRFEFFLFWCHYFFASSASIKFLWLRQIHDPSSISPAFDNALSTALSWAVHNTFFLSAFSLPLCIFIRWSRSVTTTVNKRQWWQAFACRRF